MVDNTSEEFFKCDWCRDPIESAETSYMCLDCMEGGHLVCGFRHDYDSHGEGYEDVVGVPV